MTKKTEEMLMKLWDRLEQRSTHCEDPIGLAALAQQAIKIADRLNCSTGMPDMTAIRKDVIRALVEANTLERVMIDDYGSASQACAMMGNIIQVLHKIEWDTLDRAEQDMNAPVPNTANDLNTLFEQAVDRRNSVKYRALIAWKLCAKANGLLDDTISELLCANDGGNEDDA